MLRSLQADAPESRAVMATEPRYELRGVDWTRFGEDGKTLIQAHADTGRYYDDKSASFDAITVRHLGAGPSPWTLSSPHGRIPAAEQRIELTDPVDMRGALKNGDPASVASASMWVDFERQEIYTEDAIRLSSPGREVRAIGLRGDWAGTRLQLMKNVEVNYVAPPRS
jgi:LPS export ABC transporter protein LptC